MTNGGYFDFSVSFLVCQVRLLVLLVASYKGISRILVMVLVEKWYNLLMAYIRKFKTTSGATGVQVCYKEGNRVVRTVHIGSATSDVGVEKLVKKARAVMDEGKKPLFNLERFNKK